MCLEIVFFAPFLTFSALSFSDFLGTDPIVMIECNSLKSKFLVTLYASYCNLVYIIWKEEFYW